MCNYKCVADVYQRFTGYDLIDFDATETLGGLLHFLCAPTSTQWR